jgi:SAM-dependent methyltransferase
MLRRLGLLFAFQVYERLSGLGWGASSARPAQAKNAEGPLPPPALMVLVAGTPSAEWFVGFGQAMYRAMLNLLQRQGVSVENLTAVLEFGCGCGRVLRYWRYARGPVIYGTDYNPRLIAWCRRNLPFVRTGLNQLEPPLSYPSESFDFVYAISVFTHLAEATQSTWMRELSRVLAPGGYLLMTTQGESFRGKLSQPELAAFDAGQLVVRYEETSGTNLCSAYHPPAYMRDRLADGYTLCEHLPAGQLEAIFQDIYLLRRN